MNVFGKGLVCGAVAALMFLGGLTAVEREADGQLNEVQAPEMTSIHGSACSAANNTQSPNFAWNQRGVINANPLGSGITLFVVCPAVLIDDGTAQPGGDVFVSLTRLGQGTATVTCSAIRQYTFDNSPVRTVTSRAFGLQQIMLNDVVADSDRLFLGTADFVSVVCALPPQTGVKGVAFDSD